MFEYLKDYDFLNKLDKLRVRVQYAKLILLSFDEKPIKEIQGNITAGSLSINGSSAIRRTISLTMLANLNNNDLTNLDNDISLNKKIKILIGYNNPLREYQKYGEIIWFPCGVFLVSTASITRATGGWTISISGKDKMVMLDGSVGGMLPASVTFHESYVYNKDKTEAVVNYPTIYQIIQEAVNHWGEEPINNIFITDLEETAKLLVKYIGEQPIYLSNNYSSLSYTPGDTYLYMFINGQDIGYKETDFTYPGELILKAGDSVVTLLNKICDTLGNFEFFYDIDGRFIFQEKKNYLNTGSPLLDLNIEDYVQNYSNTKYAYSLTDLDNITSLDIAPKYDEIKNDFIVWGKRKTTDGAEIDIRYHLVIDAKPILNYCLQYMWGIYENEVLLRYEFTYTNNPPVNGKLIASPCKEWREELYRQALIASLNNLTNSNYDMELLAEWRNLYDPENADWKVTDNWNPKVYSDPRNLNYWLDFIDTGAAIGKYSVNMIGRRTKVINSSEVTCIYNTEVPDVIFMTQEQWENVEKRKYYDSIGQKYFRITDNYKSIFASSSTGSSAFDQIRELLYQNLSYNTQVTIQGVPKYYLEPNNIIYIEDMESNIIGNYAISQITLPLTYSGTMSITATEVLTRV